MDIDGLIASQRREVVAMVEAHYRPSTRESVLTGAKTFLCTIDVGHGNEDVVVAVVREINNNR